MKLSWQSIKLWHYKRRLLRAIDVIKTNPAAMFAIDPVYEGRPLPHPSDPAAILKATKVDVWAYVAINTIGKNLSAAPLIVEQKKTVDGEPRWLRTESGKPVELIEHPNSREPMDQLMWRVVMSLMSGDAYLIYEQTDNELHHIHSPLVRPIIREGEIQSYNVARAGKQTIFPKEDIVHISLPDPENEFYGLSPLQPAQEQVLIHYYYIRHLKNFFKHGAMPTGLLKTDQSMEGANLDKIRSEWQALYGGVDNAHKVGILTGGLQYEQLTPKLAELIAETLYKMPREAIVAAFGTPPVFANAFEYAHYANVNAQIKMLWMNTILPKMRLIAGCFNIQLMPRFGDNIRVRFDTSQIEALRENENEKAKRHVNLVRGGIMTPNEAREEYGLEPVEGGDDLSLRQSQPAGVTGLSNIEAGGRARLPETPSPVSVRDSGGPRFDIWKAHRDRVIRYERDMQRLIRKFFDDQLDRVLGRLKDISFDGKFIRSLLWVKLFSLTKDASDDAAKELLNITEENADLYKRTDPFMRDKTRKSGQRAINSVGLNMDFNLNNPAVQTMIQKFHNRMEDINNTTYDEILGVLKDVYDEGVGLGEAERRLRAKFKEFSKVRSTAIAKTEMNGLVNGAAEEGYKQTGIVNKKEWLSAFLDTSRLTHIDANGDVVGINEKFVIGGDLMAYPGDPSGSAGNVVNCHCTITSVVE